MMKDIKAVSYKWFTIVNFFSEKSINCITLDRINLNGGGGGKRGCISRWTKQNHSDIS